ncbi:MAG: glycosyltransferase family 4 protein [Chloroflexota bacterium]|nr:glycosyltransferase family 4 protein [Chloroflexota bacterium]PLS78366.1 MAG: glycosyltransferase family 1 protein [Chloroflexota bacterium]
MAYTVLTIAPTSFFADYGCHVRIWEEVKILKQLGHRVVMTTYHNGDDMPNLEIRRSWDVPWIKRAMIGSSRHKLYCDAALSWRALRVALEVKPDIIHAHLHDGALIGAVLSRLLRIPLIFDYQGSLTGEMLDHGFLKRNSIFYGPTRALEGVINTLPDAVITSSYNAATLLHREWNFPRDRLYTVTDSVNTERFHPFDGSPAWEAERQRLRQELGIPPDRRIVAYIGLLAPYQGTNKLLEAAQQVIAARPDVHFLIMGYPDVLSYRALAQSLGVDSHVTLPGRILYKDLHAYLALGDVAVAPKMSATEGAGKITNYMAMGLPVVTFDTPVSREMLGDSGVYARLGDSASLAQELIGLLDDPRRARELGQQGRNKAVAEHSWELGGQQIAAIYERAFARRAGRPLPPVPTVVST